MSTKKILLFLSVIILAIGVFIFFKRSYKSEILNETREEVSIAESEPETPVKNFPAEHPDSIPKMAEKNYSGSDLKLGKILEDNADYTRYFITYKSEGLTISGILNIPKGQGPFPLIIMNHGYIDPEIYTNGRGLKREQDYFARRGYAVLHSDYRNHAQSDFDPGNDIRPRSGYVEDVINAIEALKKSDLKTIDKEKIGMLGHSMGGGIALNIMVIKPELVKAFVLLAPISSEYRDNFERWVRNDWSEVSSQFESTYGTYAENPELWEGISAKNYFDRITAPILLHHGTVDKDVPLAWSQKLNELLKKAGKNITYFEYPGEGHTFINAQSLVMQRTLNFFDKILKK
jgi:dipeptidyl aminopeptidase/acylaminoacyl peptidase